MVSEGGDDWVVLASPSTAAPIGRVPTPRAVVARMVAAAAVVSLVIGALAFVVSNRLAESDTLSEGVRITDILAGEIGGKLTPALFAGSPDAVSALDAGVLPAMNRYGIRRIKVFDGAGLVLYSDEHRLIGQTFPLADIELAALASRTPLAEISTPGGAENQYEKVPGQLIEVRQAMAAPDGRTALLEMYLDYGIVGERATSMWRAFLVLLVGSLALLTLLIVPVAFQLLRRIAEGTRHREELLRRAVEASDMERRRIAGSLHDGPVQELVGNTLVLSTTAERLARSGQADAAASVGNAAAAVRKSVGSLRTLLVDLYPASLDEQGLKGALDDLLSPLASRGIATTLVVDEEALDATDRRLAYRVAHECLENVGRHSRATAVRVRVRRTHDGWLLDVRDNGRGFDPAATLDQPEPGHFGLRILADLAAEASSQLRVSSGPDGTTWELRKGTS